MNEGPNTYFVMVNGCPSIIEVSELNIPGAVEVYALMWQSAYKDQQYDSNIHLPWKARRDTGGCCEWSIKGIANQLKIGKAKVLKAIDGLLDAGFISFNHLKPGTGSSIKVFRVTANSQLDSKRAAIDVMGPPSQRKVHLLSEPLTHDYWDWSTFPELGFGEKDELNVNPEVKELWSELEAKVSDYKTTDHYQDWLSNQDFVVDAFRSNHKPLLTKEGAVCHDS